MSAPLLLVYRALGLGDLLTAVPALRALAQAYPDHRRVLAAPAALAPLVALADPEYELVDAAPLEPLPPSLHGAAVAVNLHGRGPQSHAVLEATRPGRLIGFGAPPRPLWRAGEHEVARWCRLLRESGIAADPRDLRIEPPSVPAPAPARGATLIHPGAASGARRWPADRWAAVGRAERASGRAVAITGGPDERPLALAVAADAGVDPSAVLAGTTDLTGLAAAVAAADRLVCGDTGVAHLATALGTPSVVLFGPTPPAEWGPPADPRHIVLWAGRRGDPHAAEPDPGLLDLTVPLVLAALDRLSPRDAQRPGRERPGGGRRLRPARAPAGGSRPGR